MLHKRITIRNGIVMIEMKMDLETAGHQASLLIIQDFLPVVDHFSTEMTAHSTLIILILNTPLLWDIVNIQQLWDKNY